MNHQNNQILLVNKPEGWTPLQALDRVRNQIPTYKDFTLGYAGRLDPLAQGLLLLLIDDENKHRKPYERLAKTYTFNIIGGIHTDTHDLMGLTDAHYAPESVPPDLFTDSLISSYIGKHHQHYPLFSSARVKGKPLYYWARTGTIPTDIPAKEIEIFSLQATAYSSISLPALSDYAIRIISKVKGEFRQAEIIENWKVLASRYPTQIFPQISCEIRCSSGTYIRKLVDDMGNKTGVGAVAHQITRTQIGNFSLADAIELVQ